MMPAQTNTGTPTITGLRPVFVVGYPRSGTTLVQQLLSTHADFWTGPETLLFSHVLTDVSDMDSRPLAPDRLSHAFDRLSDRSGISLPDALRANLMKQAEAQTLYAANLLVAIMESVKPADSSAPRWVEKTTLHVFHLPLIWRLFPDARVVNVIRDPRDVASSPKRFHRYPAGSIERAHFVIDLSRHWNSAIEAYEALHSDARMLSVRYDDLIVRPEQTLALMAQHVGVETDLSALSRFGEIQSQVTIKREETLKALNASDHLIDRREMWKKRLTDEEAILIETICGDVMARHGYAPTHALDTALVARVERRYARHLASKRRRQWTETTIRRAKSGLKKLIGMKRSPWTR
jgi:hypothetical protein